MAETIIKNLDCETPMSIHDEVLRVDWYKAGEGLYGDYNPENPDDRELLRFDVYVMRTPEPWDDSDDGWREVEDASYCTNMSANAPEEILEKALRYIFSAYRNVIEDYPNISVKRLGEGLSWISESCFNSQNSDHIGE